MREPLAFAHPSGYDRIEEGTVLRFPDIKRRIAAGNEEIPFECGGKRCLACMKTTPREREYLIADGLIDTTKQR